MAIYKEIDGEIYRKCSVKFNGIICPTAYILEAEYKALYSDKKSRKNKSNTPRKQLESILDNLWAKRVKERDGHMCQKCGAKDKQLNSHHIFSRTYRATRWDLDNGITLCCGCHTLGNGSAHRDPALFIEWLIPVIGQSFYERLKIRAYGSRKYCTGDLEIMIKQFNNDL